MRHGERQSGQIMGSFGGIIPPAATFAGAGGAGTTRAISLRWEVEFEFINQMANRYESAPIISVFRTAVSTFWSVPCFEVV